VAGDVDDAGHVAYEDFLYYKPSKVIGNMLRCVVM